MGRFVNNKQPRLCLLPSSDLEGKVQHNFVCWPKVGPTVGRPRFTSSKFQPRVSAKEKGGEDGPDLSGIACGAPFFGWQRKLVHDVSASRDFQEYGCRDGDDGRQPPGTAPTVGATVAPVTPRDGPTPQITLYHSI